MPHRVLARLALACLAWTLVVVLGGAYVRASGSGAGCGDHWPTCRGALLPERQAYASIIEWSHRVTSGIAGLLVLALWLLCWRRLPSRHPARIASGCAAVTMCLEALIGAALVRLQLVADDPSLVRGIWMSAHLLNTFLLLASLLLTWRFLFRPTDAPPTALPFWQWPRLWPALPALGTLLLASISGGIAALGDTLFPSQSLAAGWQEDWSPVAHLWLRLRLWHPVLSLIATGTAVLTALAYAKQSRKPQRWQLPGLVLGAALLQTVGGLLNLLFLAPLPMQIVHLAGADLMWLALVLLAAEPCLADRQKMVDHAALAYDPAR